MQKTVRKVNYMEIKTVNWDQHGYKHLGLTRLISCDQAACVEKSSENSQRVGRRQLIEKKFIQNIIVTSENILEEQNASQDDQVQTNLHNTQSISPLVTICRSSEEVRALIEKSNVLFALTPVNQVKTYTERFTLNKRNTKKEPH